MKKKEGKKIKKGKNGCYNILVKSLSKLADLTEVWAKLIIDPGLGTFDTMVSFMHEW